MTRERVLYLGADDREAKRCVRALRRAGFAASRARLGPEAVIACQAHQVSVVVADLRSVSAARRTIAQLDDSGALVIAIASAKYGRTALQHGAWDYLDGRDPTWIRDLVPKVVRALAVVELRGQCAGGGGTRPTADSGTPRSLADAVIAAIAQEIKTPLFALRGYSQLLAETGAFDAAVCATATRLDVSAQATMTLVDELLCRLHAQSEREAYARRATDFNRLVAAAVARAERRARRRRQRIELHAATLLPTVMLDPVQVGRLLDGLLGVALAGAAADGVVRVATAVQHRRVVLRLESADWMRRRGASGGPGASSAVTALARVIVGAHGGEVTMEGPHRGVLGVTMRLPINETRWAVGQ